MASPRFFVLEKDKLRSRYDVEVDELEPINRGEGPDCPRCGGAIGMLEWLPPYRVELVLHGEELGDFIEPTGDDLLVSERFARAFQEEGLTGLVGFHPVEVVRVRRKRRSPKALHVPAYLVVRTSPISRAAVDMARSRIVYAGNPPTCEECREATKNAIHGYTLEPGTWGGEDIFRPRGLSGCLTVSERFARFVEHHGFTNMKLIPTEQLVWDPLRRGPPRAKPGTA
ncbi:hypothetical protein [Archangium violaceum]|uniref:hypothetical protein n=1 Tax=Archangium violaceum TaxID=83451 RepID=UPI0036D84C3D